MVYQFAQEFRGRAQLIHKYTKLESTAINPLQKQTDMNVNITKYTVYCHN